MIGDALRQQFFQIPKGKTATESEFAQDHPSISTPRRNGFRREPGAATGSSTSRNATGRAHLGREQLIYHAAEARITTGRSSRQSGNETLKASPIRRVSRTEYRGRRAGAANSSLVTARIPARTGNPARRRSSATALANS